MTETKEVYYGKSPEELQAESQQKAIEKQRDIEKALSQCGSYLYEKDHTSRLKPIQLFCNIFRLCPVCMNARYQDEKGKLLGAELNYVEFDVYTTISDKSQRNRIAQKLRRYNAKYRAYPIEDDLIKWVVYTDNEKLINDFDLRLFNIEVEFTIDWILTPEKQYIGGNLTPRLKKKKESDNNCEVIDLHDWRIKPMGKTIDEAKQIKSIYTDSVLEVLSLFGGIDPSFETIQEYTNKLCKVFQSNLYQVGLNVKLLYVKKRIASFQSFDWSEIKKDQGYDGLYIYEGGLKSPNREDET